MNSFVCLAGIAGDSAARTEEHRVLRDEEHGIHAPRADRDSQLRNGHHCKSILSSLSRLGSVERNRNVFFVILVLQKNHIYTSGASGTNAAVIRGALRAETPDLLTVILPQSLKKQSPESQELLLKVTFSDSLIGWKELHVFVVFVWILGGK